MPLAGGPRHLTTAQKMEMEMVDRLAAFGATVHDHAVAIFQLELLREIANHKP